jgi:FAD/FMN-containing dehydrogenase
VPVVPQGGNTGLVGGSVPIEDEIVVSLQGMSRILDFDEVGGSVTCEAGAVLQTLQVRKTPSWPRSWANFRLL